MSTGRRPNIEVFAITDGDNYYDKFTSEDEAAHYFDDVAKYEGIPADAAARGGADSQPRTRTRLG